MTTRFLFVRPSDVLFQYEMFAIIAVNSKAIGLVVPISVATGVIGRPLIMSKECPKVLVL